MKDVDSKEMLALFPPDMHFSLSQVRQAFLIAQGSGDSEARWTHLVQYRDPSLRREPLFPSFSSSNSSKSIADVDAAMFRKAEERKRLQSARCTEPKTLPTQQLDKGEDYSYPAERLEDGKEDNMVVEKKPAQESIMEVGRKKVHSHTPLQHANRIGKMEGKATSIPSTHLGASGSAFYSVLPQTNGNASAAACGLLSDLKSSCTPIAAISDTANSAILGGTTPHSTPGSLARTRAEGERMKKPPSSSDSQDKEELDSMAEGNENKATCGPCENSQSPR